MKRRLLIACVAALVAATLSGCAVIEPLRSGVDVRHVTLIVPNGQTDEWSQTAQAVRKVMLAEDLATSVRIVKVSGAPDALTTLERSGPNTLLIMGTALIASLEVHRTTLSFAATTPIGSLTERSEVIAVPRESEYNSMDDLLSAADEHGRDISVGGGATGGTDHVLAGRLYDEHGVETDQLKWVPFDDSKTMVNAVLNGKVDAGIGEDRDFARLIKLGRIKALAVSGDQRSSGLSRIKTLGEAGIDVTMTKWIGLVAPGSVNDTKAKKLTELVTALQESPSWRTELIRHGWTDAGMTHPEFAHRLKADVRTIHDTESALRLAR